VLHELGLEQPLLVASPRWDGLDLPQVARWSEIPSDRIEVPAGADSLLAVGGGSAIDTAHHASAQTALPVVSVPTTYSGAEWTPSFGVRTPDRRMVGGGGGASLAAIVYDVDLTLDLPREETVGTALNALAHCAEALYARSRTEAGDACALEGAALIAETLPRVVAEPRDRVARGELLRGAASAGEALSLSGLALGHAIAQALGGRFGLPHGAMNALALPAALRFNAALAPEAVSRFGAAVGAPDDPAGKVEALARLGGFERLSDFGVPEGELAAVAEAAAGRVGTRTNPRPATPLEIEGLLHQIYR
jgi:maleylacetate reductase